MNADDLGHYDALTAGRRHEAERLANAKSEGERQIRTVWLAQYDRQIADEMKRLGIEETVDFDGTDDELLAGLNA